MTVLSRRGLCHANACALLLVALFVPALYGQFTSSAQGTVVDETGAVVPDVELRLSNVNTGVTLTTQSNEAGVFRYPGRDQQSEGLVDGDQRVYSEHSAQLPQHLQRAAVGPGSNRLWHGERQLRRESGRGRPSQRATDLLQRLLRGWRTRGGHGRWRSGE